MPIATFDVANVPELNLPMCQEAAELYTAEFKRKKAEQVGNRDWDNAKMRYWCEQGRFKKK